MRTCSDAPAVGVIESKNVTGFEDVETLKRRKGNPGKKKPPAYKTQMLAFDIETTNIMVDHRLEALMYVWQLCIGDDVIIGRSWREFVRIVGLLDEKCGENEFFICFVHNLSFEFQFIKSVLAFDPDTVFCLDDRKILRANAGHIEFRCSQCQTNQGLYSFTRDFNAVHVKLSGDDFDYSVKRYPWSQLTDEELSYCVNDVIGLVEAMTNRMEAGDDTLNTLPLTSTGYVRRLVKKNMRTFYRKALIDMQPTPELYYAQRGGFRGGDTHNNRYYTGVIVESVKSRDITSSYPYQELAYMYPMTPFIKQKNEWTYDELERAKFHYNRAFLVKIRLTNIRLKDKSWGFPYIPIAKCEVVDGVKNDNGRVLEADYLETWVTDIDLEIIHKEYDYKIEILECWMSQYRMLPKQLRDIIWQLFVDKSQLKGVDGMELQYALKKSMLNSVYGLTAQDVGKLPFKYDGDNIVPDFSKTIEDVLNDARKNPYLSYQWGVWCTAYARRRLHMGLWHVVDSGATPIYVDTDSIKYIGEVDWDPVNAECYKLGLTAETVTGKKTTLGTFVDDGYYKKFISWGAKKYAYIDENDKLHITIAGVNKKKGAAELEEAGGIEKLKLGFRFKKAAGADAHYNDHPLQIIEYRDHLIELTSNVALTNSEYTLGITSEYESICFDSRFQSNLKASLDLLWELSYN